MASYQHIDLSYLEEIVEGNNDFKIDLIQTFIEQTPPLMEETKAIFRSKQWNNLAQLAHKVKSSSKFMGVAALADNAERLELISKATPEDELQMGGLINEMEEAMIHAIREFKEELNRIES